MNITYTVGTDTLSDIQITIPEVLIKATPSDNNICISETKVATVSRRMRRTTYQARLGQKLDHIISRVQDNGIRLTSNPTDMIRIVTKRDNLSQDVLSKTVTSMEIVPIVLPVMKDIPLRQFTRGENGYDVLIPSLYPIAEAEYFEIYSPMEVQLNEDDLLVRIIWNEYTEEPYVMCLQVKEILATLGYSTIISHKYYATFYDEKLPAVVIEYLKRAVEKRKITF